MLSRLVRAGCLFLGLFGLAGCSGESQQAVSDKLVTGQPFPTITLQPLDGGESLAIDSYRGRLVVLNVWATWCEPCRREMPNLQALSDQLDPKQFAVLGLAQEGDDHLVREYLNDRGVTFTNFLDEGGLVATDRLGVPILPYTLIIGPDGRFIERVVGPREWARPEVVELLQRAYRGEE